MNDEIVTKLCQTAIRTIKKRNNFVHDVAHTRNVVKNAFQIARNYPKVNLKLLKIACYWHDTGRNDHEPESEDHAILSIRLLKGQLKRQLIFLKDHNKLFKIIGNHRGRKAGIVENRETEILWDGDKLDIFNLNRIKRILKTYKVGKFSPDEEFNYLDSFHFWLHIDKDFENKFHTPEAKKIFRNKFPKFKKYIKEEWKKLLKNSTKIFFLPQTINSFSLENLKDKLKLILLDKSLTFFVDYDKKEKNKSIILEISIKLEKMILRSNLEKHTNLNNPVFLFHSNINKFLCLDAKTKKLINQNKDHIHSLVSAGKCVAIIRNHLISL